MPEPPPSVADLIDRVGDVPFQVSPPLTLVQGSTSDWHSAGTTASGNEHGPRSNRGKRPVSDEWGMTCPAAAVRSRPSANAPTGGVLRYLQLPSRG